MEEIFRSQNCLLYESGKKFSLLDLLSQMNQTCKINLDALIFLTKK